MTVFELRQIMASIEDQELEVAAWVEDNQGAEAYNLSSTFTVDQNEGFIAFKLEKDL